MKKLIFVFFCFFISSCVSKEQRAERWRAWRAQQAYYNSKEGQCERLRRQIAGSGDTLASAVDAIFDALDEASLPADAYGIPTSRIIERQKREKQKEEILQKRIAIDSYKALCK